MGGEHFPLGNGFSTAFQSVLSKRDLKIFLPLQWSVYWLLWKINEPVHEISNNVFCVTSKASDQPAHTRSLIRAFASRLSFL